MRESLGTHSRWLPWIKPDYALSDSEQWIARCAQTWQAGTDFAFQICDAKTKTLIGGVGLNRIRTDAGLANLGYWVRASCTGRGYATRATRLLAHWGLAERRLLRIEIRVAIGNHASQRVAEKSGARFEGIIRNGIEWVEMGTMDAHQYAFVSTDLQGSLCLTD